MLDSAPARNFDVDFEDPVDDIAVSIDPSEAYLEPLGPLLMVEQYIAWSPTFQVPVFYFTVNDAGGAPISLRRLYDTRLFSKVRSLAGAPATSGAALFLPPASSESTEDITTPFPLLTQGDHPMLGTPCWSFHPCETSAAVQELLSDTGEGDWARTDAELLRWLEAWFAVLSGVVNMQL